MKNIIIWGTSFKKIADEAQLLAHRQIVNTYSPTAKITYITKPRKEIKEKYPEIDMIPFSKIFAVSGAIAKSDLIVIGGGPFYEDISQLIKCILLIIFSKLLKIPIIVYGATIIPIHSAWAQRGYRYILNNVNAIVARDHSSYESLISIGVPAEKIQTGTDLRFSLNVEQSNEIENILKAEGVDISKPFISISTRYFDNHLPQWVKTSHGFDDDSAQQASKTLGKVINSLSAKAQLVLIPMHPHMEEDLETARAIQNEMDDPNKLIVLKNRYPVNEILGIIKASKFLITGRVGSVLFGAITDAPVLGIAYDKRTTELMSELGLENYVFEWKKLNHEQMLGAAEKLLQEHDSISNILKQKVNEFRLQAQRDSLTYKHWLEQ